MEGVKVAAECTEVYARIVAAVWNNGRLQVAKWQWGECMGVYVRVLTSDEYVWMDDYRLWDDNDLLLIGNPHSWR